MKKKALFIGGTGTISTAITRRLAGMDEWELTLVNRGNRLSEVPEGVRVIKADINDEDAVRRLTAGLSFDVVADFIGFIPQHVERDYRLFSGRTAQYIYISSASAYNKPSGSYIITEGTTLCNPYWEYSRNKIACEDFLMRKYRENGFPVTLIRPSHTYDERSVPLGVHGAKGSWQVVKRMIEGKRVIIHGDGTSLWTFTHSSDFAKGFVGLMGNVHSLGEAFQIMSDETLTWNQAYASMASVLGVELKPYYVSSAFLAGAGDNDYEGSLLGDKACSVAFDCSKLKRIVPDFQATIRFDQGIRSTIQYVLSHPECQIPDSEFDEWCDRVIVAQEEARCKVLGI